jgi:ATP adenylyltransferase
MDILHAYWRMDYVTSGSDRPGGLDNPFRELPKLGDDRKALIVHRAEHHYLVLNRYPYNPGHLLIVPYREVAGPGDLEPPERLEMMDLIAFSQDLLQRAMNPAAFNVGFNLGRESGAGIPEHLHCHVVPRWNGDTNFISVIGETRTLPQALDQTWEVLTGSIPHA